MPSPPRAKMRNPAELRARTINPPAEYAASVRSARAIPYWDQPPGFGRIGTELASRLPLPEDFQSIMALLGNVAGSAPGPMFNPMAGPNLAQMPSALWQDFQQHPVGNVAALLGLPPGLEGLAAAKAGGYALPPLMTAFHGTPHRFAPTGLRKPLSGWKQESIYPHETRPDAGTIESISSRGLLPSRPRGGAPSGVYLARDMSRFDPAGDVPIVGVNRSAVKYVQPDPMFPDWAILNPRTEPIPPHDLWRWNGPEDQWLPLTEYSNPLGEFDLSKIGTGEGAQAYGHGIYLAEHPGVAKQYQANLAGRQTAVFDPGTTYRVDLPDEQIARMLDWDAPWKGQQPIVQDAVTALWRERGGQYPRDLPPFAAHSGATGESIYNAIGTTFGGAAKDAGLKQSASTALSRLGIPGLQYLDQGSRAAGQGTRNFVVWNPDILRILGIEP